MKECFKNDAKEYRHIYIDMPGFGASSNNYTLDSYDYAKILKEFLSSINSSNDIIVGHSFGGKIASLLECKTMILLSSAGIPTKKSTKTKIKISTFKFIKKLGLGKFYRYFASNDAKNMDKHMYETFKKVVDENFTQNFKNSTTPTYIFWGIKDTATPLTSGKTIHSLIKNSHFYECEGDHFFFMQKNNIKRIINNVNI